MIEMAIEEIQSLAEQILDVTNTLLYGGACNAAGTSVQMGQNGDANGQLSLANENSGNLQNGML